VMGSVAGHLSGELAGKLLGNHALEKTVSTLVKEHGWKPIEDYLKWMLDGVPGGTYIAGQIKSIIEKSMVRTEFDTGDNAEFKLLAGLLKEVMAGSGNLMKPLGEYLPTLVPLTRAVNDMLTGVDMMSELILGPPPSVDVREKYSSSVESVKRTLEETRELTVRNGGDPDTVQPYIPTLTAPQLHEGNTDRDITEILLKEQVISEALGVEPKTTGEVQEQVDKALEQGILTPERHEEVTSLVEKMSEDQLLPLGDRGGLEVSHTPTGRLDRVEAQSHQVTELREELEQLTRQALSLAPEETTTINNFVVGKGYSEHSGKLDLTLPKSEYGYTDTAMEGTRSLLNVGWSMLGYNTESHKTGTEVRQLYNTCNKDEKMLSTVTRFLDPEVARSSLVQTTLEQMRNPGTGLVQSGDVYLKLKDPGNPRFTFNVQRVDNMVTIGIEALWDIEQFGNDPDKLRTPEGGKPSQMRSTVVITVNPGQGGGDPKVDFFPMGVMASVNNVLQFDLGTGSLVR
jgi:hypothetical protein